MCKEVWPVFGTGVQGRELLATFFITVLHTHIKQHNIHCLLARYTVIRFSWFFPHSSRLFFLFLYVKFFFTQNSVATDREPIFHGNIFRRVLAIRIHADGPYGRTVWASNLKFGVQLDKRPGYKPQLSKKFYDFSGGQGWAITDLYGPAFVGIRQSAIEHQLQDAVQA